MRDVVAIVQPAADLARIIHDWETLEGQEQRSMAEFRAAKVRLLIQARDGFSARGDGFVEFVEKKLKTPFPTAQRWMSDAGYKPPKKPGAGGNHAQSEHDSNSDAVADSDQGDDKAGHDKGGSAKKPSSESAGKEQDPENYRTAFLLRANAAVEYATMTPPLLADYYRFKPKGRDKHHKEFIAIARRAADAWNDLANQLETK